MNGREVFKFVSRRVPLSLEDAIKAANVSPADIDWLLLHQANKRIIDAVAERLNIPKEKVRIYVHIYIYIFIFIYSYIMYIYNRCIGIYIYIYIYMCVCMYVYMHLMSLSLFVSVSFFFCCITQLKRVFLRFSRMM